MHTCSPQFPVAGVSDIVAPISNWATCMIMPYVHHYCHVACIACFLMGRGFDANTALAMAQEMMGQQMGGMGGMPGMTPGMTPGMAPGMPGVPGIPG